jgi:hypothetical protein
MQIKNDQTPDLSYETRRNQGLERPLAITLVSWLIIAAGAFGMARGFVNAKALWPPEQDLIWVVVIDTIGIACGVFMLRGQNWARWLALAWVGGHVAIVSFYMRQEILPHIVIFALVVCLMFRADVRAYFGHSSKMA